MENRTGLVVDMCVTQALGTAERETALALATNLRAGATLGADKGYDTREFVATLRQLGVTPHVAQDLRHGVAMEVLEQHHDLEEVRAPLGHARIDTAQIYANIRPAQLKRAVAFYEEKAMEMLSE